MKARIFIAIVAMLLGNVIGVAQTTSIVGSLHNLSASGRGAIRAANEQEICIFCHTPHNAAPIQPLWNRNLPVSAYTVYSSTSLQAKPGQPTGSSKLCLSCHDGTIAVGSVLSRAQAIAMVGGITTLPPGHSNLGTDLSDDHPISFRYDSTLAGQDVKLKAPSQLPPAIKLDQNQELQCTSCHDAHNDVYGKFLVMDNTNSQLCNACHQISSTNIAEHNQCASCHQMHTAPSGAMLLTGVNASESCLTCHNSQAPTPQGQDIATDMTKVSRHYAAAAPRPAPARPGAAPAVAAAPVVNPQVGGTDVTCASCHEPHTMQANVTVAAPLASPKLGQVSGVNATGSPVTAVRFEYEVCFKCHDSGAIVAPRINRQIVQTSTRLEFNQTAVSFHPIVSVGKNNSVPSLRVGLTPASRINCTDCHTSDTSKIAGGVGPNGPHGSNDSPLLAARYDTLDNTPESSIAYALCYRCHDRTSILNNESFTLHRLHVETQHTPCSVCHDAHGISSTQGTPMKNSHLINFDTSVVQAEPVTGKLEYVTHGIRSGECTLSCHGAAHGGAGGGASYPAGTLTGAPAALSPQLRRAPAPSPIVPQRRTTPVRPAQ